MKKKVLLLILFLLLFPSVVLAKDTCNNDDIKIEEITIEEKEGYTEELTPVSIDNNKINLNIEMYNVGESITYKIKVKNNSNNDYYFTKDSFNLNTEYLEYEILNDNEVIKSTEEKEIELKITYKEKIPEDSYNENNMMSITLSDTPLTNPSTKRTISLILLVIFITMTIFIIRNKKLSKILVGIILCFIPIAIKALCTINLEINADITINHKEAIFLPGTEVNTKMKKLSGDNVSASHPNWSPNNSITMIKYSKTEPNELNKEEKNLVSMPDSSYPIYMWYEEGTIYWWSEDKTPNLNENASYMFHEMEQLTNILDLKYFDASNAKNLQELFGYNKSLNDITPLKDWDISNVTNLSWVFRFCYSLSSIEALSSWDVSKVETLASFLMEDSNITSLKPLKNWNTSNVTSLFQSFLGTGVSNLEGLENWNTSSLENMTSTFSSCQNLVSIEALKDWDVSHVERLNYTFLSSSLKKLSGLENWDVSSVTMFSNMFATNRNLTDASAINDWNIQSTANFRDMFNATPTHPDFTKVPGTWSNGTFTPTP